MRRWIEALVCGFFVVVTPLVNAAGADHWQVPETPATFVTPLPCESGFVYQLQASAYLPNVLYGSCSAPQQGRKGEKSTTRLFSLDVGQSPVKVETFDLPGSYPDLSKEKAYNSWNKMLEVGPKSFVVLFDVTDEASSEIVGTGFVMVSLSKGTTKPIVLSKSIDFNGPLYLGGKPTDSDGNAVSSVHPYTIYNAEYLDENKSLYFHVKTLQAKVKEKGEIVSNPDVVMQYQIANNEPTLKYYRDIFYSGERMAISGHKGKRQLIMFHDNGGGELYLSVLDPLYKLMVKQSAKGVPNYAKGVLENYQTAISIPDKDPVIFPGIIDGKVAQAISFDGDVVSPPVELVFPKSFPAKMTFLPGPAAADSSGIFYIAEQNNPFILRGYAKWTPNYYKIQPVGSILFANNPTCSEPQTISELGSLAEKENKPLKAFLCPGSIAAMATMGNTLYVARGQSLLAIAGCEQNYKEWSKLNVWNQSKITACQKEKDYLKKYGKSGNTGDKVEADKYGQKCKELTEKIKLMPEYYKQLGELTQSMCAACGGKSPTDGQQIVACPAFL